MQTLCSQLRLKILTNRSLLWHSMRSFRQYTRRYLLSMSTLWLSNTGLFRTHEKKLFEKWHNYSERAVRLVREYVSSKNSLRILNKQTVYALLLISMLNVRSNLRHVHRNKVKLVDQYNWSLLFLLFYW